MQGVSHRADPESIRKGPNMTTTKPGRPSRFSRVVELACRPEMVEAFDRLATERDTTRAHEMRAALQAALDAHCAGEVR